MTTDSKHISSQSILTAEELAALLTPGANGDENLFEFFAKTEQKTPLTKAFDCAFLAEYRMATQTRFCGYATDFDDKICLWATLNSPKAQGIIAFSEDCIKNLTNQILGASTNQNCDGKITPIVQTVIDDAVNTFCRAANKVLDQNHVWRNSACSAEKAHFDKEKTFLEFSLKDTGKLWFLPPSENSTPKHINIKQATFDIPTEVTAEICNKEITLSQLTELKVGSFLPLAIEKNAEISILSGKTTLFRGRLGRKGHHVAVKITKKVF